MRPRRIAALLALAALSLSPVSRSRADSGTCDLLAQRSSRIVESIVVQAKPDPRRADLGVLEFSGGVFDLSGELLAVDLGGFVLFVTYPGKDGNEWIAGELRFSPNGAILPGDPITFDQAQFTGTVSTTLHGPESCRLPTRSSRQGVTGWPFREGNCGANDRLRGEACAPSQVDLDFTPRDPLVSPYPPHPGSAESGRSSLGSLLGQ